MWMSRGRWVAVLALALTVCRTSALPNTRIEREKQVDRVLESMPVSETLANMVEEAIKGLDEATGRQLRENLKEADPSVLTETFRKSYLEVFTADELAFLADYSSSPVGISVQKKMPRYVGRIAPTVKTFIEKNFPRIENAKVKAEGAIEG